MPQPFILLALLANLAWSSMEQDFTFRAPDAVGNLFRTGEKGDRKYGPGGQLLEARTKDGITTYSYDAEGNLIRKEVRKAGGAGESSEANEVSGSSGLSVWTYHWNVLGMLEKVVRPDGREVRFGYDALGRRLKKQFDRKTTHWVWDGNVPLHEWVVEKPLLGAKAIAAQKKATEAAAADKRQNALLHSQPSNGPSPTRLSGVLKKHRSPGSSSPSPSRPWPSWWASASIPSSPITWARPMSWPMPRAKRLGQRISISMEPGLRGRGMRSCARSFAPVQVRLSGQFDLTQGAGGGAAHQPQ